MWLNQELQIPIKKKWKEGGILTVCDVVGKNRLDLSISEFEGMCNIKNNFLEYGAFCLKINDYLRWKDIEDGTPMNPCNSYLNILFSIGVKDLSQLYKQIIGRNDNIIDQACAKWNEKIPERVEYFSMRKSFVRNDLCDDVYLRYIQFRTLHRRFFSSNIL